MGLFTDFYNTVARFFRPQEEFVDGDNSKSVATNRLKLVLMQDRTNLTPKILEQMRGELVDLLSKYLEMDKDLLELNFEQEGNQVALMLSIPVIRAKDEEEIEEALKAAEEAKSAEEVQDAETEEISDEDAEDESEEISEEEPVEEELIAEDTEEEIVDSEEVAETTAEETIEEVEEETSDEKKPKAKV